LVSEPQAGQTRVDGALRAALLGQREFGVAVCDANGLLTELNPTLEAMLGARYQPMGPARRPSYFNLCDEGGAHPLDEEETPLARALRGERVVDEVISARPPGRPIRFLRCNASRLYDAEGVMAGAVVFVADVTAEVEKRHALDALRERLVETVNHELRTPVCTVKGHVELLDGARDRLTPEARWSVDALARGMSRLERALDMIRELADRAAEQEH
jgi:signal transduction histidine kinase